MLRTALGVAALTILLVPAAALAEPVLVDPPVASLAANRPLFSWTEQPGEDVAAVVVASNPGVTPEGEFFSENRVDFGSVEDEQTSYQDTTKLQAGAYWWQVDWQVSEPTFEVSFTAPRPFTIPAYVRSVKGAMIQYGYIPSAFVSVSYVANMEHVKVTCVIKQGKRRVSGDTIAITYSPIGTIGKAQCDVKVPEALDGKLLSAVVTVAGGGTRAVVTKPFRAK